VAGASEETKVPLLPIPTRRSCVTAMLACLCLAASLLTREGVVAQEPPQRAFDIQGCAYSSWSPGGWADPGNAGHLTFIRELGADSMYVMGFVKVVRATGEFYTQPSLDVFADMPEVLRRAKNAGLRTGVRVRLNDDTSQTFIMPWEPKPNAAEFFSRYKDAVLRHALVAQAANADLFVIGNEMNSLTGAQYRSYWVDIIADVRKIFTGPITYGHYSSLSYVPPTLAGLNAELSFWDLLDYVGLSVYPPLLKTTAPTVDDIVRAWRSSIHNGAHLIEQMKRFHLLTGKRVLIQEIGFRSIDGAALSPGDPNIGTDSDFQEQADLYEGLLTVLSADTDASWFAGLYIFDCTVAMRPAATFYNSQASWGWARQYPVDNKPAAEIIRSFFTGQRRR